MADTSAASHPKHQLKLHEYVRHEDLARHLTSSRWPILGMAGGVSAVVTLIVEWLVHHL